MLFNSYEFILLFLPITLVGFFLIARRSHWTAALWLTLASLFFYSYWNPPLVLLLLASILWNYVMGYQIGRSPKPKSKRLLIAAITINLLLLAYFKYTNFFITTINDTAGTAYSLKKILLPLGISFFTFTQIAFLVDVYRGIVREYRFLHYILFVTYFPHLIAGPLLHHKQMMPQFELSETYRIRLNNIVLGCTLFAIGLAKKILLADPCGEIANPIFEAAAHGTMLSPVDAWIGALTFTLQIYFDFSGYTDMAIGLSKMFNINLPINFNSPYRSRNIIEFWRRWHMTLSQFLRDYLYIPLGGNRKGKGRRYVNLMATMLLGGLWHGASWTFVIWGGLHGFYLVVNNAWQAFVTKSGLQYYENKGITLFMSLLTFIAVISAWVFFRATSFHGAMLHIKSMLGFGQANIMLQGMPLYHALAYCTLGLLIVWWPFNTSRLYMQGLSVIKYPLWVGVAIGLMFTIAFLFIGKQTQFIYFQF